MTFQAASVDSGSHKPLVDKRLLHIAWQLILGTCEPEFAAVAAATGSTTQLDIPAEEVEKFQSDHSQNGGPPSSPTTEEDDEDESLVYVPSPKVPASHQCLCLMMH